MKWIVVRDTPAADSNVAYVALDRAGGIAWEREYATEFDSFETAELARKSKWIPVWWDIVPADSIPKPERYCV